ncbi:hypothetical protein C7387_0182 [Yokenella regensburgei]|jgi:hypothetical protein|uniref:Type II toxin-antitoxin system RelE/ParE family toxin n=1 Tax=Yokenella regensburgei TaxID=158877 RepID=A0ABX9RYM3_9ENTR|nr:hypothetical protein [Yokenella regensburgei]EHM44474.1 toxin-antitoxin system, toxin component, RelE family [Yokenella regensburgei ATCC 43003]RKR63530.1 hypothetical protein C7387_0182 [Yokenella regensburgei]VFS30687.1 Uncharacterised protein [Yokenella regensburgei]
MMKYLSFIETPLFSRDRHSVMEEDEFQELQSYLLEHHEHGYVIAGTGGCQKIRWSRRNVVGKRGGIRVIYYVRLCSEKIYLLMVYPKNVKDDLTEKEKQAIAKVIHTLR